MAGSRCGTWRRRALGPLALLLLAGPAGPATAAEPAGPPERVSLGEAGREADARSVGPPALSADGRFVAFASYASNLVAGDANRVADVFVRDRATGAVERVSVGAGGREADRSSSAPAISADGRFVAFASNATTLVADDTNRQADVFVFDRATGATERVSVDSLERQAAFLPSGAPSISADGRFVAFESNASNLVPDDDNRLVDSGSRGDVFVRDREAGTTERVSVDSAGNEVIGISAAPSISASGRLVAFESTASGLASGGPGAPGVLGVYLHDRATGATTPVSVSSAERPADAASGGPVISGNGRAVVFWSAAANLGAGADGPRRYVRDLRHGTTELLSAGLPARVGPAAVSGDGWIVAVAAPPAPAPPGQPVLAGELFLIDRQNGTLHRVSGPGGAGTADPGGSGPALSSDARAMAFVSAAGDLVAGDTNDVADVFVLPVARVAEVRLDLVPDAAPAAFRLSGAGFAAGEALEVRLDGVLVARRTATGFGAPAGRVRVPPGTAPGAHAISVIGTRSAAVAEAVLTLPAG